MAFGQYPKQFSGIEMVNSVVTAGGVPMMTKTPAAKYSAANSDRTIYCDFEMLSKRFPEVQSYETGLLLNQLKDDQFINGADAHNWFIHMEDNLNRATGQFDRTDYRKFTRCVHVAWSGDVGDMHYMLSEDKADGAGKNCQDLIKQLHRAQIKINIIAHSMGNRVLLKMMDLLGSDKSNANIIEYVFMCEAAVPQNALSNDATKDISVKQNCHFVNATKVAKKISVLYSNNDSVLKRLYPLGNMTVDSSARYEQLLAEFIAGLKEEAVVDFAMDEKEIAKTIRPALGLVGPDKTDVFIKHLIDSGKLVDANTTPWIDSHSAMRIETPRPDILQHVYHDIIIKAPGFKFGIY